METDGLVQDPVNPVPSNASAFSVPPGTVWLVFGGACVFTAFSVLGAALAFFRSSDRLSLCIGLAAAVGFGAGAILALRCFNLLRARIALNETGIWYLPYRGQNTFISWKDVSSLKADDTGQRLILTDASQNRAIKVEYQLENFKRLREAVLAHTTMQRCMHAENLTTFHRTWINKIVLAVLGFPFLVVSFLSYREGLAGAPLLIPFCIGILAVISIVMDPLAVSIVSEAVVIKYPGWKRSISFDSIRKIAIQDVYSRGNTWLAVVIERTKHRPIRLFRFNEGSIALHEALEKAWEHAAVVTAAQPPSNKTPFP